MAEDSIKGSVLLAIKEYLLKDQKEAGYLKYLQAFSPEDQMLLDKKLVGVGKVPARIFAQSGATCMRLFGQTDKKYFQKVMSYVAEENINSFMKVFMRLGNPALSVKNTPLMWKHYFSASSVNMLEVTSNSAKVLVEGGAPYGEALCQGVLGFGTYVVAYSGGKNVQAAHPECIHHGGARCFFTVSWE